MANTRETPAMAQYVGLSLSDALRSCKSYEEAMSKVRDINEADCHSEDLPDWTPAAGTALQRLTEMVLDREHLSDCCNLLQFQALYANNGKVEDPKPLILSYLQFTSFSKTVVSLNVTVMDMKLFWQCLNWLLKCLLRNYRDVLLSHLPEIGQELLCSVLDTTAHIGLRRLRVEELNDLLEVATQGNREAFKKKCGLQVKDLCNLLKIAGNYDFQTSIVEAIFRLSTTAERVRNVSQWFPMVDCTVHSLFTRISDFEPDCRRFLNAYNASHGHYRLVYTFPCLSAFVGEMQLIKPKSVNYEKFWVDFNTACSSVLIFHQMIDSSPEQPWESLTVSFDDINTVTLYRTVQSFKLVFVMKHVENMVTLFSSPLLQEFKDLVTDTITLEFECSELLQKAAYILYEDRLNVVSQEPEGLKCGKKHRRSKESSSSGSGQKVSSSVVVPCTLEGLTTRPQVSAKQRVGRHGGLSSSHSGHSSGKKTSVSKLDLFLDTEDSQLTSCSEKMSPQKSAKKLKTSVSITDIDASASLIANEDRTVENTKISIAMVPHVSKIAGESAENVLDQNKNENFDSPFMAGSLDRFLPTQDADLLNKAMDSYESKKEQKKHDNSSESDKEIVPCSLSTQERLESHRVYVDLKSRKKPCPEQPVVVPPVGVRVKTGSEISGDEKEVLYIRKSSNRNTDVNETLVSEEKHKQPGLKGRESVVSELTPNNLPGQGKMRLRQRSTECKEVVVSKVGPIEPDSKGRKTVVPEVNMEATPNNLTMQGKKRAQQRSSGGPVKSQMTPKTYPLRNRSKFCGEKCKDSSLLTKKAYSVSPKPRQRRTSLGTSPKLMKSVSPNFPSVKSISPMVGLSPQSESPQKGKFCSVGKHLKDVFEIPKSSLSFATDKGQVIHTEDNAKQNITGNTYGKNKSKQKIPELSYSVSNPVDGNHVESVVSNSPRPVMPDIYDSATGPASMMHSTPISTSKVDKDQKISPSPDPISSKHAHQKTYITSTPDILNHDKLEIGIKYECGPDNTEILDSTLQKSDCNFPATPKDNSLTVQDKENSKGGEAKTGDKISFSPQPDENLPSDLYTEAEKTLSETLQSESDPVPPASSAILTLAQLSTPVTTVTAMVHQDASGLATPQLHTPAEFLGCTLKPSVKWPDTPRPTLGSSLCLPPLLMPGENVPYPEAPNVLCQKIVPSPDTGYPILTGSFSAVPDDEVFEESVSGSPETNLGAGDDMSKSPVHFKVAQEKTAEDKLDHASDLRSGSGCITDCSPHGSLGKTAEGNRVGNSTDTGERNVYDTNGEKDKERGILHLEKDKENMMEKEIEREIIPDESVLNLLGSGKSPSKALMSTLKILAEYPVKPSGLKTPGKQFDLGRKSGLSEPRTKANTYPTRKKTKSAYPTGRCKSTSPSVISQKKCDELYFKSKKKLYDTFSESMLIETPPQNTSVTNISMEKTNKDLNPSKQKNYARRHNDTYTIEKETSVRSPLSSEPESFNPADNSTINSSQIDSAGRPKRGRGRPPLSSGTKKSKVPACIKPTKKKKDKRSKGTLEAGGFLEYPEIKDSLPTSHTVYSDFDFDSHPETDHSWMYEKKRKKNVTIYQTYKNRSKSRSLTKDSSEDEWAPFKLRKKRSRKQPENLLSDSNNEESHAKKPRRERRPRNCQKRISYEEDTTDSEHKNNKRRHSDSSEDLVIAEKSIPWQARVERGESPELLRNTSRSSVDSGPQNLLDFKLSATKFRDKDPKLQKIQPGIAESFGFSSQEENDAYRSKPVSKRIRKSVEDTQIKDMLQKILPQQEKACRLRTDPELLINLSDSHPVPQPPNNTPVSMEIDHNISQPFDMDDPKELILDTAANPDNPSEQSEAVNDRQEPRDVDTTQAFDVGEISEILKNKVNFPNASVGPLQSTLIHEPESCLVSHARFSYISEADNSYIEQSGNQCSGTGLNSFEDNERTKIGSPSIDDDMNPWLRLDESISEDPDYERVSRIPRHPGSSPSDEGSPLGSENHIDCSPSPTTNNTHTAPPETTESSLVPDTVIRAKKLSSPDTQRSLPAPSLELYSRATETPVTCSSHKQEALKVGVAGLLEQHPMKQHGRKSLDMKERDYCTVISELAELTSDTRLASQTTSKLTNILEKLSSNANEEPDISNLHTPCTHEEMQQKTPPRLIPRDLFSTTKYPQAVTDDPNMKIMYDVLNTLWTPMSNASLALNRVVSAIEEAKELLTAKLNL
ncbi:uncharacterized protein LOC122262087 [Penaeus japonicus]|uniref:uncharacterized protein LOC122262087 n=1 Tax=Penaeus japonicus TaxID=27405 RepID=UPI001C714255|nr:uncharacterized protein LOC122262087 [Penaeus japonicus]